MFLNRLYAIIAGIYIAQIAGAQTSTEAQLAEVEVVSRHTFSDVIPSQTLSGETLQRLSTLNIADALRYFSGLQVKDYGGVGGLKTVNIRSMGSHHLGVYYDGIQLGNAQNGQTDLGQFSLDNVEEITLYNGQKSSLMQTASDYGNAGNVYIRTREPKFRHGEQTHFRSKVKYGISNMLSLSAVLEQKLSPKVKSAFSIGTLTSNGRYDFRYKRRNYDGTIAYDTTAVRQNGDVQLIRFEGNIYGLMERGSWNLKAYTYQSNRGIPGAIVNNNWYNGERQTDSNNFLQGSYQMDVTSRYTFRALAKYAYYYTHYRNLDPRLQLTDNIYRQQEGYFSTTHALELLPWLNMSMAYDLKWSRLSSDMMTCPTPTRWTNMVSLAASLSLSHFNAQASLLYNNTRDRGEPSVTGTAPVGLMNDVSRFTPALFLNYYLLQQNSHRQSLPGGQRSYAQRSLSVRAFVKNNFRMPTFNDLYYKEMTTSVLRPEKATQYNLGLQYDWHAPTPASHVASDASAGQAPAIETLHFQADAYYNDVKDKIVAYPGGQQFRWTMKNFGRVHITGIDAEAYIRARYADLHAGLRLQYTYQKAIDVTDEHRANYRHQIPYVPWHSGSIILDAEWKGITLSYSFIYTGERYNQQENIQRNYMQPWYTSDLSLSYQWFMKRTEMRATLECNNLLSQDYDVILNYPMPKRNFALSFQVSM